MLPIFCILLVCITTFKITGCVSHNTPSNDLSGRIYRSDFNTPTVASRHSVVIPALRLVIQDYLLLYRLLSTTTLPPLPRRIRFQAAL